MKIAFLFFAEFLERGGVFFLFSVVEGLTPGSPWPWISPAPGVSRSSRERRTCWTVPDGTKSRKCKLSTLCKHILTVSERMIKQTQQNNIFVSFVAAKDTPGNWKIGEMFGKLPVLLAKIVFVLWTTLVCLYCEHIL